MKEKIGRLKNKASGVLTAATFTIPTVQPADNETLDPQVIVREVIEWGIWFVGAIALVFVIYGGITYVMSGGDSEKTTKARNTLLYAVAGIIVVVLALALINWAGDGAVDIITP